MRAVSPYTVLHSKYPYLLYTIHVQCTQYSLPQVC